MIERVIDEERPVLPPPEGWTLVEAAAAWFPRAWKIASAEPPSWDETEASRDWIACREQLPRLIAAILAAREVRATAIDVHEVLRIGRIVIPVAAWEAGARPILWPEPGLTFLYVRGKLRRLPPLAPNSVLMPDGTVLVACRIERATEAAAPPPRPGLEAARAWMRLHGGGKRDVAIKDCMNATGCTRAEARQAWTEVPPELRNPRGRPRKG